MEEIEKFEIAKEKGFTYNPNDGLIYSGNNKLISRKGGKGGYIKPALYYFGKQFSFYAHRYGWWLITGELPLIIDHINRNKLDNRFLNLRNVTQSKNCFNTEAKGYWFNTNSKKWQASIMVNRKVIYLGLYDSEIDASNAYKDAKLIYHC